jgi:hypothetical protein
MATTARTDKRRAVASKRVDDIVGGLEVDQLYSMTHPTGCAFAPAVKLELDGMLDDQSAVILSRLCLKWRTLAPAMERERSASKRIEVLNLIEMSALALQRAVRALPVGDREWSRQVEARNATPAGAQDTSRNVLVRDRGDGGEWSRVHVDGDPVGEQIAATLAQLGTWAAAAATLREEVVATPGQPRLRGAFTGDLLESVARVAALNGIEPDAKKGSKFETICARCFEAAGLQTELESPLAKFVKAARAGTPQ